MRLRDGSSTPTGGRGPVAGGSAPSGAGRERASGLPARALAVAAGAGAGSLAARRRRRSVTSVPSGRRSMRTSPMSARMSGMPRPRSSVPGRRQVPWSRTTIGHRARLARELDVERDAGRGAWPCSIAFCTASLAAIVTSATSSGSAPGRLEPAPQGARGRPERGRVAARRQDDVVVGGRDRAHHEQRDVVGAGRAAGALEHVVGQRLERGGAVERRRPPAGPGRCARSSPRCSTSPSV